MEETKEQELFDEIEKGKKSAEEQGFISFADSKKEVLGKTNEE